MATVTINYASYATFTISPENVASSSSWTAGVESTAIDNSTNLYVDALVAGMWTCGTTPTANTEVRVYVYAQQDDTPTYQDVFDGTSSAETVTSAGVLTGVVKLLGTMYVDATTSNRAYYLAPTSVAEQEPQLSSSILVHSCPIVRKGNFDVSVICTRSSSPKT